MTLRFTVKTRDVDGSSSRRFKTQKAALARFQEMSGLTLQQALDEMFSDERGAPTVDADKWLSMPLPRVCRAVSNYGTVVTLLVEAA